MYTDEHGLQCDIQTNVSLIATGVSYNHNRHPLAHKRQRGDEGELGRTVFGPMRCITNGKRQEARAKGVKFYPRAHARAAGTRERWALGERKVGWERDERTNSAIALSALWALPEKKMSFHQIKPRAPRRASQERSQRGGESAGPACGPSQPGPSEVSRWDWGKQ